MEDIVYDFDQKVTSLAEKFLKNGLDEEGLSKFTDDLEDEMINFGKNIVQFMVSFAEEAIFNNSERKENFNSIDQDDRHLISIFGDISFKRRYYLDKETNERVYLLDEYLKIAPNERLLLNVKERAIEEARETSYERAGRKACLDTTISKQTIKNLINSLQFNNEIIDKKEKKKIDTLYIMADEDHVHLQNGGTEMPRLIIVYEGVKENGTRTELINKKHFGGVYKNNSKDRQSIDDLWEEVLTYVESEYDMESLKTVYVLGDGASWIKKGTEWFVKGKYVLDEFHMDKAVNEIAGTSIKLRTSLKDSLRKLDFKGFKEQCYAILAEEMDRKRRESKHAKMDYILNNKEGIRNLYENKDELHGCSAEGHISHIYSDRMSSRPLGWSTENVDNMSRLRLAKEDNVDLEEIIKNSKKFIEFKKVEKIRNNVTDGIKSNINFKPVSMPIMSNGTEEERRFFKEIMDFKFA